MESFRRLWRRVWRSRKKWPSGSKKIEENNPDLQAEAESLEEILKNQSHPKNLVAVKKSGTPVVATREFDGQDFVPGQRAR